MTARSPMRLCLRSRRTAPPARSPGGGHLGLLRAGRDGDRGLRVALAWHRRRESPLRAGNASLRRSGARRGFREAGQDQGLQVLAHVSATFAAGDRCLGDVLARSLAGCYRRRAALR